MKVRKFAEERLIKTLRRWNRRKRTNEAPMSQKKMLRKKWELMKLGYRNRHSLDQGERFEIFGGRGEELVASPTASPLSCVPTLGSLAECPGRKDSLLRLPFIAAEILLPVQHLMQATKGNTNIKFLSQKIARKTINQLLSEMESEKATNETLVSEEDVEEEVGVDEIGVSKSTSLDQKEILRVLEVVERDSVAIADSFTSLFASLRLALAEVTSTSVDHMQCFSDAAGRLQECALDAATKGNHYINSCLRMFCLVLMVVTWEVMETGAGQ
ncbi:hypothetical protein TEA_007335 [Camellia sinensis var. sinensis]|uniref:BLOC-1-related complex subunit 6 C-terminal helix domain-containing protein n=1 Tax=Camellia sinensis var. sinensis TaxID=542762 RepID=A0A4S4E2N6_CAMSN|nr:hypothetical protein TEA_007335 [Camellia sinensis var. sinensis]